ncbi:MAG: sigma-70 family RNA polymerase sigma factor [Archangium sp.]|nr:sigma-70 family RNA polymerase sigma factor [Archangium sp.]
MTDREALARLLDGVKRGEEAACRQVYLTWRPGVLRLLEGFAQLDSDEREDLVQEIFTRAFRAIGNLKSPETFEGWLYSIARNRGLSALARKGTRREVNERYAQEQNDSAELIPDSVRAELDIEVVRGLIAGLPEGPEKETVRLFYVEGELSAREIAEKMGVGKSAVTMRLERFRARVRRQLMLDVLNRRWEP